MKYVLMFTSDPAQLANVSEEDTQAVYGKVYAWFQENAAVFADSGAELQSIETATTVKHGGVVVDGPFNEAKEVVGGFSVIDVARHGRRDRDREDLAAADLPGCRHRDPADGRGLQPVRMTTDDSAATRCWQPRSARSRAAWSPPCTAASATSTSPRRRCRARWSRRSPRGGATVRRAAPPPGSRPPPSATPPTCCAPAAARPARSYGSPTARRRGPAADQRRPPDGDDRLPLLFACCHPALAPEARLALTLRAVIGLTTPQIARAFLVNEQTLAQRIVRAKRKIVATGIELKVPDALDERLPDVLAVVYLAYNEAFVSSTGSTHDRDLGADAVWLAEVVADSLPEQAEAWGLAALLRIQHGRAAARFTPTGDLVLLRDQDRSLWDGAAIKRAGEHLERAASLRSPGRYQLQAAIAMCHAEAPSWADTDWLQIVTLYSFLIREDPSPVVRLNGAIALAQLGPRQAEVALADLERLADDLAGYHLWHAARAELLRVNGRDDEAGDGGPAGARADQQRRRAPADPDPAAAAPAHRRVVSARRAMPSACGLGGCDRKAWDERGGTAFPRRRRLPVRHRWSRTRALCARASRDPETPANSLSIAVPFRTFVR